MGKVYDIGKIMKLHTSIMVAMMLCSRYLIKFNGFVNLKGVSEIQKCKST